MIDWKRHLLVLGCGVAVGGLVVGLSMSRGKSSHAQMKTAPAQGESAAAVWTCSMHPQVRRGAPGDCPICGMALVKQSAGEKQPTGKATITYSARAKALAKLRTTKVTHGGNPQSKIRLLGMVESDESSLRTVTAWTAGRIDKLVVTATGQRVRRGQIVARMYSPEVFAAHQDLIIATGQVQRLVDSAGASADSVTMAKEAVLAVRDRLSLLGVPKKTIDAMAKSSRPYRSLAVRSPHSGTVIERLAAQGSYVATGEGLFKLADLSSLWVQLDAYESDLPQLSQGQKVLLTAEALPGRSFSGKIDFIDPVLDPRRRTVKVRVVVDNEQGALKPGMFVQANVEATKSASPNEALHIPASAVLFAGDASVVYVESLASTKPTYEARVVLLGPRMGDSYPVVAGIGAGEQVVTRGAFVLDADLQIRGGDSLMNADTSVWEKVVPVGKNEREMLRPIVAAYLDIQKALADDAPKNAAAAAQRITRLIDDVTLTGNAQRVWLPARRKIVLLAKQLAAEKELAAQRREFYGLSLQVTELLQRFGNPMTFQINHAYCPMALENRGAHWWQTQPKVKNPYFGHSMHTCGAVETHLGPGRYLPKHLGGARAVTPGHRH